MTTSDAGGAGSAPKETVQKLTKQVIDFNYPAVGPVLRVDARRLITEGVTLGWDEGKYAERRRICNYLLDRHLTKNEVAEMLSFLDDVEGK